MTEEKPDKYVPLPSVVTAGMRSWLRLTAIRTVINGPPGHPPRLVRRS